MSDGQLQRQAEAVARSQSLRRLRNVVLVGTCVLLIVAGFVVSTVTAYEMGYVDARSGMGATPREIARFHLLIKSEVMGVFSGAGITLVGMVTLFRVLKERDKLR
jgi:ABC-type methionine transport system permease subunit